MQQQAARKPMTMVIASKRDVRSSSAIDGADRTDHGLEFGNVTSLVAKQPTLEFAIFLTQQSFETLEIRLRSACKQMIQMPDKQAIELGRAAPASPAQALHTDLFGAQ